MVEPNDHDTLVRIETTLNMMMQQQADFYKTYDARHSELVSRVVALEVKQAANMAEITNNSEEISSLRKVNNIWNGANSLASIIAGIMGVRFG